MNRKKHGISESTIALMAGNIAGSLAVHPDSLSVFGICETDAYEDIAERAVRLARFIAAEVQRTETEGK